MCGGLVVGIDLLGLSWRPVFLINIPIGIVALVVGLRRLPRSRPGGHPRLDLIGVALLTVAMTAVALPLIVGPTRGWPIWCWVLLGTGVVVGWLFVRQEVSARHPVLDLEVLRNREVPWGLAACCLLMGCYTVFLLALTIHLQSELGFEPLRAGLTFVPYYFASSTSELGLWRVTVAVAVLLVVTTWCATLAVRIHRRRLWAG